MPPPDDRSALRDMRDAYRRVHSAAKSLTRETFARDWTKVSAFERQLSIVGEATKRLTRDFRVSNAGIDWRGWAGLRDILVHAYDEIDLDQLWEVVTTDLPALLEFLEALSLEGEEDSE